MYSSNPHPALSATKDYGVLPKTREHFERSSDALFLISDETFEKE